jgi:large subunit ribosomal protein L1
MGKRINKAREIKERELQGQTHLPLKAGIELLKKCHEEAGPKFTESLEVIFKLGVDPKQSNQMIRGSVAMPNGLGKTKRIAVFAQPERHKEALAAGADLVGDEDLIAAVQAGKDDFDICIATPDMMSKLASIGKILGTKGKMPNPKLGTVSTDLKLAIERAKKGTVEFRVEKGALIHAAVGKINFATTDLEENIKALYEALVVAKPTGAKGVYMKNLHLTTSQGTSVVIDLSSLN